MPTPPTSGTSIDGADITTLYEDVRARLNDVTPTRIRPRALGPEHLPGLVVGRDKADFTTFAINTAPAALETVIGITGGWQDPAALYLNNGGLGYAMPPCLLHYWISLRASGFPIGSSAAMQIDHQVWANLYYAKNGTDQTTLLNSRVIYGQVPGAGNQTATEDTITIFGWAKEASAFTLSRIGCRFALNRGGSAGAVPNFTIDSGQIGFFGLWWGA